MDRIWSWSFRSLIVVSFSSIFNLHASRSILRDSFSNSLGSVARVALALVLDALFCLFPGALEAIETVEEMGVDTTEEETAETGDTTAGIEPVIGGTGVDGFIRDGIGGPDQMNFGSEEKTEASIEDET